MAEVSGCANIYEQGKIGYIRFLNDDGLLEAMKTEQHLHESTTDGPMKK